MKRGLLKYVSLIGWGLPVLMGLTFILLFLIKSPTVSLIPPTATIRLATESPAAIRPGTQVPLMRFNVVAGANDFTLNEVYFQALFCEAEGAGPNAENFTLWQGPDKISQSKKSNLPTVEFSRFSVEVRANSTVLLEVRGNIAAPNGAMMETLLTKPYTTLPGLPIKRCLRVLPP